MPRFEVANTIYDSVRPDRLIDYQAFLGNALPVGVNRPACQVQEQNGFRTALQDGLRWVGFILRHYGNDMEYDPPHLPGRHGDTSEEHEGRKAPRRERCTSRIFDPRPKSKPITVLRYEGRCTRDMQERASVTD